MTNQKPSFLLLFLLISFASVSAVLFTPALPEISQFFHVSENHAQLTITLFLIGYAIGQLFYGPLANRYGRKKALFIGIGLAIMASILCLIAGFLHAFALLVFARFVMALGASVGLKMTFTLIADCYDTQQGNRLISHLMIAFAITPGLGVAFGGWLTKHFAWQSCFVALGIYGIFLFLLICRLKETLSQLDKTALNPQIIIQKYTKTLTQPPLILGGLLMGLGTSFVYIFASAAPFIAMNLMHLNPVQYGNWNLVPPLGIILGSQLAAKASKKLSPLNAIFLGLAIMAPSILVMFFAFLWNHNIPAYLFLPLAFIYVGVSFIFGNASSIAMQSLEDKSSASAMMNFFNMGTATILVLLLGLMPQTHSLILPIFFIGLIIMAVLAAYLLKIEKTTH